MIEEDLSGNSLKGGLGEPGTRVESPNPRLSVIYATSWGSAPAGSKGPVTLRENGRTWDIRNTNEEQRRKKSQRILQRFYQAGKLAEK